jgi:hypothetical protein
MKTKNSVSFRRIVRSAPSFAQAIAGLMEEGLSRGRAILLARRHDPEGFNCYMKRRWNGREVQTL